MLWSSPPVRSHILFSLVIHLLPFCQLPSLSLLSTAPLPAQSLLSVRPFSLLHGLILAICSFAYSLDQVPAAILSLLTSFFPCPSYTPLPSCPNTPQPLTLSSLWSPPHIWNLFFTFFIPSSSVFLLPSSPPFFSTHDIYISSNRITPFSPSILYVPTSFLLH